MKKREEKEKEIFQWTEKRKRKEKNGGLCVSGFYNFGLFFIFFNSINTQVSFFFFKKSVITHVDAT
jgi:hypothetical protein